MGLGSYFKNPSQKAEPKKAVPRMSISVHPPTGDEKNYPGINNPNVIELIPQPAGGKAPSIRSTNLSAASMFLDDIKHEVMVNYLFQQQCSMLWVGDGAGESEGVILRKARGRYMACPPSLGHSPFAMACAALNVQV